MASLKVKIFLLFLLFHAMFLLSSASVTRCGSVEDNLLDSINDYRTSVLGLPALIKNKNASCLATEIVDTLSIPCTADDDPAAMVEANLEDYPSQLKHCFGNFSNSTEVVILRICIPDNDEETVQNFYNYSHRQYGKYVKVSSYNGAGVGFNENWMVIVFNENTTNRTSAEGKNSGLVSKVGFVGNIMVSLLLGMLIYLGLL